MIDVAERTNLTTYRLERLKQYALEVAHIPGDVIEVGVWKGGSAKWLCHLFPERTVYLFDTFAGMPTPGPLDGHGEGDFGDTCLESVRNYLVDCPNSILCSGVFPKSAEGLGAVTLCLAHIDCDLYTSTRDAIAFAWPRLNAGGVMVLDDYKSSQCKGATKAIDEFAERECVTLEGAAPHEAGIARKA